MVQQYKNLSFRLLFMSSCIQAQFGSNQKMYQLDFSFFTAFLNESVQIINRWRTSNEFAMFKFKAVCLRP
jgi:hypothetical protein